MAKKYDLIVNVEKKTGGWAFEVEGWRGDECVYSYMSSPAYARKSTAAAGADRFVEMMRDLFGV